jgi:hypothetical protein
MISVPIHERRRWGFKFEDTTVVVTDDDGNEVGTVVGMIGGGLTITCYDHHFCIDAKEIWYTVLAEVKPDIEYMI